MLGWCFEPSDAPPVKTSQEMKLLTALAPAVFLVGLIRCSNYLSERQAMDACLEWKADEVIIDYGKPSYSGYQRKVYQRLLVVKLFFRKKECLCQQHFWAVLVCIREISCIKELYKVSREMVHVTRFCKV